MVYNGWFDNGEPFISCGLLWEGFSPVQEVEETKFMAMVVEKIHGKTDTLWLFNMAMEMVHKNR